MAMGIKQTVKTSMSAIGTTLGTIDSSATYIKNVVDEAIRVQEETSDLRVKKSVLEAKRELAQDIITLTEKEKELIKALDDVVLNKPTPTQEA